MAPNASMVLEGAGIFAKAHRAMQVSKEMLKEADLILVMGLQHSTELRRVFGDSFKLRTLPSYVNGAFGEEEISDPYGSTIPAYRASSRQLLGYVDLLLDHLER